MVQKEYLQSTWLASLAGLALAQEGNSSEIGVSLIKGFTSSFSFSRSGLLAVLDGDTSPGCSMPTVTNVSWLSGQHI